MPLAGVLLYRALAPPLGHFAGRTFALPEKFIIGSECYHRGHVCAGSARVATNMDATARGY